MESIFNFIVKPKTGRSTSLKLINGNELLLNTELQNHNYVSRQGIVISKPLLSDTNIKKGDEVILHHNVFRRFYDVRGNEKNSKSYFEEDKYFVQPDQIYAYKSNGEWKAEKGFCFIKPVKEDKMFSINSEKPGLGIIKYTDGSISNNTLVSFKVGMEYEFFIEEERLYRVPTNQITIKYEYERNEEEYNPSWTQGG
tara:strand:+ start:645 stop:1235 length:591 start_codon:yes stop_codon:yes gene_type:complete